MKTIQNSKFKMNRLCLAALLGILNFSFLISPASAAELVTATITLTNIPAGLPTNITLNASTRVWTNNASGSPGTSIQITNTVANSATNLLNHLTDFPVDTGWYLSQTSPTNVLIRARVAQVLTITFNPSPGWAFVTYNTQTVASPTWTVRVPITVEAATNQTNIASLLVDALSRSTNALGTNWNATSTLLTKGASPVQAIASPVQFNGRVGIGGSLNASNGFTSSITNINSVSSNHINYGNAIRSEGSGANSLQVGSNALALGSLSTAVGNNAVAGSIRSVAIGNSASATNGDSLAIGTSSIAVTNFTIAIGNASQASRDGDVALGYAAVVTGPEAVGIGWSSTASGTRAIAAGGSAVASAAFASAFGGSSLASKLNSLALGWASFAGHSNSAAVGPPDHAGTAAETTTTNQIVLGTANHAVSIPGVLSAESYSNITAQVGSTNRFPAGSDLSFGRSTIATVANGHNTINVATNVYVDLTGSPSAAWTWGGITGGNRDGKLLKVRNSTGWATDIIHNSGTEPTATLRITTPTSTNVTLNNSGWAEFLYDATASRWQLVNVFNTATPAASATNALASLSTNGVQVTAAWTNANIIYGPGIDARVTNVSGNVAIELRAKSYRLFTLTNNVTVTNTTSPTSLITNALLGSQLIPANTLTPGAVVRVAARGMISSASATACETGIRFNNDTLIATNIFAYGTSLVNDLWGVDCVITVRSSGASGSVQGVGHVHRTTSTGSSSVIGSVRLINGLLQTAVTVDTTVDQVIDLYIDPGATTHGFTVTSCLVELLQ
jgi:hypothetical protein